MIFRRNNKVGIKVMEIRCGNANCAQHDVRKDVPLPVKEPGYYNRPVFVCPDCDVIMLLTWPPKSA